MKRQNLLLAIFAFLIGGIFLWQSFSFARLQGALETQTHAIAVRYATLIQEDVIPLGTTHALNEAQSKLLEKIQTESTNAQSITLSVENRVTTITNLQLALNRFATVAAESKEMASDPLFAHLQEEVGERGEVRTLLEAYNATAVKWNQRAQSDLGSLVGKISGTQHSILPYLRFDGQQEFVPVISL